MRGLRRRLVTIGSFALVSGGLALAGAGCGGGSSSTSGGGAIQEGGEATFVETSYPQYMDPAVDYTAEGWQAMWNTYIPLLTYARAPGAAGTKVVPGLAKDLPDVSQDGKTYTLQLRDGLVYSDGTPVKASDFEFAIKRCFDLDSGGSALYTDIVGAKDYMAGKTDDIKGITANDNTGEITIQLERPRGTFTNELGLMFAAPIPPDTPTDKPQTADPPPGTGPYEITKSEVNREFVLERNPEWATTNGAILPDIPDGHLDKITEITLKNQASQTTQVEQNKLDFMVDPPPVDLLPEVQQNYGDRFRIEPTTATYYIWMDTTTPPFNDVRVRQAVNYAIDPGAIDRLYGGLMTYTQQVLPPALPGYKHFELYPYDMAKAKQLIAEANPSDLDVTMWTDDEEPNDKLGAYIQDVLKQLGFNAQLKIINGTVYFQTIGNQDTPNLDIGFADWFMDYPHPSDFFDVLLNGENILPRNNNDYGYFNDPTINKQINDLAQQQLTPDVESQYANVDRQIMEQAPWAPYGNRNLTTFVSDRINFDQVYFHQVFNQDYTSFAFTK
jgi:peptide/nickel transport system substrate-binding protein